MINVAITGAGGFVGSYLMKLSGSEYNFHALSLENLMRGEDPIEQVDHVIHLAAKTFVPDSWTDPAGFYNVNVMGTQAVLDYCRKQQSGLTYVSSYVYGIPHYLPIDEAHPAKPNTPYNHSKLMGEELCRFYSEQFNVNIAIVRPFNLYGPGQKDDFLIPTMVRQILANGTIRVQTLQPKRDYLFIDDFVKLLIHTIGFKGCDVFNAGFGKSYSVEELALIVRLLAGKPDAEITESGAVRANEVMDVVASIEKSRKVFGWMPLTTIEEGLLQIINSGKEKSRLHSS